ncbi:cation diffusion facilitator family transporter [Plantibacter sp. YIM 135347]|uniref:cation diffusion facilitator family transporter n=1 Tax=Plantibacter sp. YIM 135347 TaxID=3423919 RepID=UPI003D353B57
MTVVIAFAANILVAIAKTIAAVLTGSASMVAESAHSWADAGNEVFLLIAERRSARRRDAAHPRGYGKEAYVWSMFAAFGLFSAGAAVSITHGVQELFAPEPADNYGIAYIVLAVSAVLEGVSFTQAYRQVRSSAQKRGQGTLHHVVSTSNTTLRAVFAEDAAALIGLALAFGGVLAHQLTGSPIYDAIGSILVGVLLGIVAIILIDRNRRFLVGEAGPSAFREEALRRLIADEHVDRVTYLHLEFVGPDQFSFQAAVDLTGDHTEGEVAVTLRGIATRIETLPYITEAVLTLSLPDEPSLHPRAD